MKVSKNVSEFWVQSLILTALNLNTPHLIHTTNFKYNQDLKGFSRCPQIAKPVLRSTVDNHKNTFRMASQTKSAAFLLL